MLVRFISIFKFICLSKQGVGVHLQPYTILCDKNTEDMGKEDWRYQRGKVGSFLWVLRLHSPIKLELHNLNRIIFISTTKEKPKRWLNTMTQQSESLKATLWFSSLPLLMSVKKNEMKYKLVHYFTRKQFPLEKYIIE